MENETKVVIRLPEDLLCAVKAKANRNNLTVSALVRKFFLAYVADEEITCDTSNSIYSYNDVAKQKRELKEAVKLAHDAFNEAKSDDSFANQTTKEGIFVDTARARWKRTVADYKAFCDESKTK